MEMTETNPTNDISYIWSRVNFRWLATGLLAGLGAATVMLALASYFGTLIHREPSFPLKLVGAALLGTKALDAHSFLPGGLAGLVIHFSLASFFGVVFAQTVAEWNRKRILILLGTLAGLAVWLFWSAMFMPAFNEPMTYLLPKSVSLLLHAVFGFSFGLLVVLIRPVFIKKS